MDDLILNETKNFKILLIGANGSGKSTLIKQLNDEELPKEYKPSSASEFTVKNIMFEGYDVTLQLWDIVGDNLSKSFLRGTNGIILVTDLTSLQSNLDETVDLFHKIKTVSGLDGEESFPFIIAGNKYDLLEDKRSHEISINTLNAWRQRICPTNKNAHIFEISAKSGYNVNEMLDTMLRVLLNKPISSSEKIQSTVESAIQSSSMNESSYILPLNFQSIKAKVVLAGMAAVGKTCILSRNSSDDRTLYRADTYEPTTGTEFRVIDVPIVNKNISLQIWDSAGSNITKAIYKNADCLILVYDISSRDSFVALEIYWEHFMRYAQPTDVYEFPVILVGNKCDLDSKRAVHIEEIMDWCAHKRPRKPISYIECSALLNMGVRDVFLFIAEAMHDYKIYVIDEYIADDESGLDTTNYENFDDSKSSHYSNSNFGTDFTTEDVYDEVVNEKKPSPKRKHGKNKDSDLERNCFVDFLKEISCL